MGLLQIQVFLEKQVLFQQQIWSQYQILLRNNTFFDNFWYIHLNTFYKTRLLASK